jgi:hypothetical protein
MTVELSMTAKTVKDALVVPTGAVFKNAEGADYVLLAGSDEKAHQKAVQLGIHNSEITEIAKGINAGDPVVTTGGYAVPDGAKIQVEKPGADEKEAADADDKDDKKDEKPDKADKAEKPGTPEEPAAKTAAAEKPAAKPAAAKKPATKTASPAKPPKGKE